MRPIYENRETLAAEDRLKAIIEKSSNLKLHKLPRSYVVDYAATEHGTGKIVAWFELKCRSNAHDRYGTYLISANKWQRLVSLDAIARSYLIVEFTDGRWYVRASVNTPVVYRVGGRTDRGDAADVEPVVHIPMSEFMPHTRRSSREP